LASDGNNPDEDGEFQLTWDLSFGADNYTIWRYTSLITEINGSVIFIANTTDLFYDIDYTNGTYYFIIEANNEASDIPGKYSDVLSNCISQVVQDPPWDFDNLASNGDIPDGDGNFDLTWDLSFGADNYTVFRHTSFITEINGTITEIDTTTNLYWNITSYLTGTYYFIIRANNEAGNTTSNCIFQEVLINIFPGDLLLETNAENPDTDGIFDLFWNISTGADNYTIYEYSSLITEINETISNLGTTENLYWNLTGYDADTYYFLVTANNLIGNTSSNCISIFVILDPPGEFNLTSNVGLHDSDGNFQLNWTESEFAFNYSIYWYYSNITEINGSVTLINKTNTLSNCISVVVIEKESGGSGGGGSDDNDNQWIRVSTIFTVGLLLIVLIIIIMCLSLYLGYKSRKTDEYKQPKKAFSKNSRKPKSSFKKNSRKPKKAFKKLKH